MRPAKACLQCRKGKRRCDLAKANSACPQCIQRNVSCSALQSPGTIQSTPPATYIPATMTTIVHDGEEILQLVDLYFKFIHNQPHTLFHEPSFRSCVINGTASPQVLLSMMGLSARFANDAEMRSHGSLYAEEAKKILKDNLEHVCIENIQACILVGNICLGDSDPNAESLYFALANRMAQILKLGDFDAADDGIMRETKLRLWWTCFVIDTWSSGGSNLSRQFKFRAVKPRVPMDDTAFFRMEPGDPDIAVSDWKPGLWGYMVKLVEIYVQIQDLNRYLAESPEWDEDSIEDTVQALTVELDVFEQSLRPEIRYSEPNLALHVANGMGGVFVAFHLGFHYYCMLLFYQYLDQNRPPTKNRKAYASRCKFHARTFCDILQASRTHRGADALYNIVGHITVVCSSVLLHTYLFGDAEELPDTRRRLESNLESLILLRRYWSSVELMINRLVVFQNSCMRSLSNNTHRFDRWMVSFLLEHAVPLDEKESDPSNVWQEPRNPVSLNGTYLERSRVTESIIADMQNSDIIL